MLFRGCFVIQGFHEYAERLVEVFEACATLHGSNECAVRGLSEQLNQGMYSVLLRQW